ncbi:hypothetical protein BDV97DRAFT_358897 [Delphinella strobiligena]|nr:hypothetical protein BDV97DRAFT_358897 [Delphinella strobiligena]
MIESREQKTAWSAGKCSDVVLLLKRIATSKVPALSTAEFRGRSVCAVLDIRCLLAMQ